MLELIWKDNVKARVLRFDGTYTRVQSNTQRTDSQESFLKAYAFSPERIKTEQTTIVGKWKQLMGFR
jgi:hypothetical protein